MKESLYYAVCTVIVIMNFTCVRLDSETDMIFFTLSQICPLKVGACYITTEKRRFFKEIAYSHKFKLRHMRRVEDD